MDIANIVGGNKMTKTLDELEAEIQAYHKTKQYFRYILSMKTLKLYAS